jgi:hypothetical protein
MQVGSAQITLTDRSVRKTLLGDEESLFTLTLPGNDRITGTLDELVTRDGSGKINGVRDLSAFIPRKDPDLDLPFSIKKEWGVAHLVQKEGAPNEFEVQPYEHPLAKLLNFSPVAAFIAKIAHTFK